MRFIQKILLVIVAVLFAANAGAAIKDAESSSHSDEAAQYGIESVYEGPGFRVIQFKLGVLSHFSYILESDGKALMIDPGRDVATYLDYAEKNALEWAGTFLTHSHADFVAGHREMAHATGSPIYVSHLSGDLFPHLPVRDGDKIEVGKSVVKVIETPGHTPDGLCALVSSAKDPEMGHFLFTGDTLFVGSVGRPDLMGGSYSAAELAGMIFDTWNNKLAKLPDSVVILPAHGAGSLCGAHLRDEPSSTIGQERVSNNYLKLADNRSAFIAEVLSGLAEAPAYFKENARINREGPEIVDWNNPLGAKVENIDGLTYNSDVFIVDVRDEKAYSDGHIRGSVNIALRGRLETWTGIIIPFKSRIILRGSETQVLEAARRLKRVGYNADYLAFDMIFKDIATPMTDPKVLYEKMNRKNAPVIVDVRLPAEWLGMRIGEVLNLPLNKLDQLARNRLNPADEIVAVCNSAFRSSLAIGLLERAGFSKVSSMKGGGEAWVEAGLPTVKVDSNKSPQSEKETSFTNLGLPEIVSAAEVLRIVKDLPGTVEIIDIRPAEQVSEFNPLQAKAVSLPELIESQTWLVGDVPLLITDRDGTVALIAAGIVSQKTRRPIRVLRGGIEAIWRESFEGASGKKPAAADPATEISPKTAPDNQPSLPGPVPTK
ncbi:MAG: MBL fold metallo-hydrolase, partial [Candidatus Rifleibacteriota bacterium]